MADEEPLVAAEGEAGTRGETHPPEEPPEEPPGPRWRNEAAFWLLGLCNNAPYVLMLSAARDILEPRAPPRAPPPSNTSSRYDCDPIGTGAVLLADILPTLLVKAAAPFGAHLLPHTLRVVVSALCAWGSFSLVASGRGVAASLGGVGLASAASGLGEVTLVPLAGRYPSAGVSGWSSGTGGAGVGGALAYGALAGAGLPLPHTLLPGLLLPHISLLSYFFLLRPLPPEPPLPRAVGLTWGAKWQLVKAVLPHGLPLAVVYFAEYFINQGLLELLYFPESSLTHAEQYRWLQLTYQGGVFAARSSLRCLRLRRVWILALLQVLNAALLLAAVAAPLAPGLAAAFALVAWEGLVGGAAFANTFSNVAQQVAPEGRDFALTVAAGADTLGVALAGGAALGVHGLFCPTA